MHLKESVLFGTCGAVAGAVNGLFGGGGGMLLVPMLTLTNAIDDAEVFPISISTIAPICIVSLLTTDSLQNLPWSTAFPYLLGSTIGGILAGLFAPKIPTKFLHRILGILILWGGIRYLC